IVTGPSPANLAALSSRGLTIGNTIYLPPGMNKEDEKALIIHELVHVMQYEKTGGIYALEALAAQHIGAEYDYGDAEGLRRARAEGKHFRDFNREQQAQIVEDYYVLRQRPGQQSELRIYENFIEELKRGDL
ncbi:MAG: DUF4157 domain-containing protein, partial [Chloroflexales bacterium]|nr:DUF4157 domain-containing protein [Chloroflexales bacterium]